MLSKTPFFTAKSDYIPGVLVPRDRIQLIREKGEKGKSLPEDRKMVLLEQLADEYLHSPDPNVREESIRSIMQLNLPEGFAVIKASTNDEAVFVRMAACDALAKLKTEETAHALRHVLLHDPDADVRHRAAKNLAVYPNDQDTIQALGKALDDKTPSVRFQAMQSLRQVSDQNFDNDILRWKQFVNGEAPSPARKRSFTEKLYINQLPMFN
ncbi:MAG: HEAT repeat domain-containing protein [Planctomycetaceae bacterium]|nr:HEAT repeat domain-containing protein [Planctomycetaceae bacterium]